jgi:acetylglutamate synthase
VFKRNGLKDCYFADVDDVIYEKDFEGVAIMKAVGDIPYLDKFAVTQIRQGTGLGQSIWDEMKKYYPKFAWRASLNNPVNCFYMKNCTGMMRRDSWNVYWNNLSDSEIMPAVQAIEKKQISWVE